MVPVYCRYLVVLLHECSGVMLLNFCSFSDRLATFFQGEVARHGPTVDLRRTYAVLAENFRGRCRVGYEGVHGAVLLK